jgi:hypothetical protein
MVDESSVYSFTTYNTTHYSDLSNRLHQKVNSYAIEINQKIKDDNESLIDMEEGIIALANYLNGVEDKRPSVTELIGSRINLDDCLKLKLEIREKIRKTKTIRTDLFTSVETSSPSQGISRIKSEMTPTLTPQTSRMSTPKEHHSRKSGLFSDGETESKSVLRSQPPTHKSLEFSKSLSNLPLPSPIKPVTALPISTLELTRSPEKRTSQGNILTPSSPIRPLVTPLIPSTTQSRTQKSHLMPVDDLADRQLAWLLNIEAKNRQTKHALEAQMIREVIHSLALSVTLTNIHR